MAELAETILENYDKTLELITRASQSSGRNPAAVKLVVVSKAQPIQVVEAAIEAGIRVFGENYPEEAVEKINVLRSRPGLEWHMIGHLQSRKAKLVAEAFNWLHSLDSIHLAEKLNQTAAALQKTMPVLLEMNVSGEESKSGWPAWEEQQWSGLVPVIDQITACRYLKISGLMTMPPYFENPQQARPYFARLCRLRDYLSRTFQTGNWDELSMGTSVDFAVAVEEGATFVRVGQAILGPRPPRRV